MKTFTNSQRRRNEEDANRLASFLEKHPNKVYRGYSPILEEELGIPSLKNICKAFKRLYGMNPTDYHVDIRVAYALSFILKGFTIAEAAKKANFVNGSRFGKLFYAKYGCKPHEVMEKGRRYSNKKLS